MYVYLKISPKVFPSSFINKDLRTKGTENLKSFTTENSF